MSRDRRLFGLLCAHKWEANPVAESPITRTHDGKCVGTLIVLRCERCGDLREKRVQV